MIYHVVLFFFSIFQNCIPHYEVNIDDVKIIMILVDIFTGTSLEKIIVQCMSY
jgi:hypothetical protein